LEEFYPMISVEEALEKVLSMFHPLEPEEVDLLDSLGRVLAEDVFADMDIPPLDNSAMDGYAVRAEDTKGASPENPRPLRIIHEVPAGYISEKAVEPGTAIRIMTGAPIPPGADAVVRFEDTRREGDIIYVLKEVKPGAEIRRAGEDVKRGELKLPKGTLIRPAEIGMLAALGKKRVKVIRRPRVAILATGDELVDLGETPGPGKIRNTNTYSNAAQVIKYGGIPIILGIARDRREELAAKLREGIEKGADLILTSGGVSVGDFDLVKEVLALEGEITFWQVRMKPGKPLAFGVLNGKVPLLGLPGNPVSVMVAFELFARPAILKMQGRTCLEKPTIEAILLDEIPHKDERRHFVRVMVERRGDGWYARLTGAQGSGILTSMVKANGLAIIPEDWKRAEAGSKVKVLMLDWPEEMACQ